MIVISEVFLKDQLKCLHLFRSFHEANDKSICMSIQKGRIFDDRVINLRGIHLSPYDVECVTLFLTSSPHRKWKELNLWGCNIQDQGLHVLHRDLLHSDVTIGVLDLLDNGLTRTSSPSICDVTIHCRVEELVVRGNDYIGEDHAFYDIISHPSSTVVRLNMSFTRLTCSSATVLFIAALTKGKTLQQLYAATMASLMKSVTLLLLH